MIGMGKRRVREGAYIWTLKRRSEMPGKCRECDDGSLQCGPDGAVLCDPPSGSAWRDAGTFSFKVYLGIDRNRQPIVKLVPTVGKGRKTKRAGARKKLR